ncbi:MAG: transcriptional regulator [Candidatus Gottesmanbacteria bacterium GW2011_GWB1_43_11]|uniref:Probable transcriptional regulatory protein UV61_C0008G0139 n=1 Tax=Candidatus Gottesmanbacteria bacterium GW2011_GWB1_43_11 TaxID=1618446 RepID=A0A0G1EUI3_9BACT|nr:MAG: transcriptional regulator [Candidatus Gottesmanbacteria bacterium GW2011_GWA2_42_16]KKS53832.1 MAG: transcriptional regulator [Candidatus Gottesmanbacteria bacterium GW2011_GWA1_42_26]KKS81438.1 MAG: transcriptional regulator [Candidatus Gottesmanbacteria bacterium GW2011_GWC1_43_10]KKS86686.1 MAG: transcriptional regulator [Candidatus Gottesmanbacteria bacterium GW2011_GWB1_43_11]OGG08557.1 MAG: hypothetical protein A2699_00045 [Candidatus Gottesmanbacteria bacterium RIFCSPHIGHO2_01_FU
MSGHSKWSTIKHQKQATDAARGQVFTKLANAITIAVRSGGEADPEANFHLRLLIEKARAANMPKANIERAISRALGKTEGIGLTEVVYEGFGPSDTALLIEGVTDNRQRTSQAVKNTLETHGGRLGSMGSVNYMFNQVGEIILGPTSLSYDQLLEQILDLPVRDLVETDQGFTIYTQAQDVYKIRQQLIAKNLPIKSFELIFKPTTTLSITDVGNIQKIRALLGALEDLDDIHKVYTNAQVPGNL